MILRRFMKHVTDQNWFAVGLDVIVVIVGIFLGLQVQQWSEDRADRLQENIYINRLHDDVINVNVSVTAGYDRSRTRNEELIAVTNHFANKNSEITLEDNHCAAIVYSHIYFSPSAPLPTIAELINSGTLAIISDQELRTLISDYSLSSEQNLINYANLNSFVKPTGYEFPDLIITGPISGSLGDFLPEGVHQCDYAAMSNNRAFANLLNENSRRYNRNTALFLEQLQILGGLHTQIDQILGLSHVEKNS